MNLEPLRQAMRRFDEAARAHVNAGLSGPVADEVAEEAEEAQIAVIEAAHALLAVPAAPVEAPQPRPMDLLRQIQDALVEAFYDPDPADPTPEVDYAVVDWVGVVRNARSQIDRLKASPAVAVVAAQPERLPVSDRASLQAIRDDYPDLALVVPTFCDRLDAFLGATHPVVAAPQDKPHYCWTCKGPCRLPGWKDVSL